MSPPDRGLSRMIAIKRLVTGSLGLLAGLGMIVMTVGVGRPASPMAFIAATIFLGGGAWSLRDGLRYFLSR